MNFDFTFNFNDEEVEKKEKKRWLYHHGMMMIYDIIDFIILG
jgi:hypothetical protein